MKTLKFFLVAIAITLGASAARPCSRVVFLGEGNLTLVGRTLDWKNPIPTNLYVYPRGMEKQGMPKGPTLRWRSKYGTVLAVSYDGGVTEGMNEAGLVMNGLFCKGSVYTEATGNDMPVMSLAVLVSYFLDNFASVDQVQQWLASNKFAIFGQTFDGGTAAKLHWAITDQSGMTLILEYENGKLDTYASRDYQVLTNDPPFPQMLAINEYWEAVGGTNMLPGSVRSADRFARAAFFIKHQPTAVDAPTAAAQLASVMNVVSVPMGYMIEGEPNLSSTQWRSIADTRNGLYYFHFASQFSTFWIDLHQLDLSPGAPVLKLDTSKNTSMHGNVNNHLQHSQPFTPMW